MRVTVTVASRPAGSMRYAKTERHGEALSGSSQEGEGRRWSRCRHDKTRIMTTCCFVGEYRMALSTLGLHNLVASQCCASLPYQRPWQCAVVGGRGRQHKRQRGGAAALVG